MKKLSEVLTLQLESDGVDDRLSLIEAASMMAGELLPPVYIISHKRANDVRTLRTIPGLKGHAALVVAEAEVLDYIDHAGDVDLLTIPAGFGGHDIGVGRARQFCLEHARDNDLDHILILDDDLEQLSVLYSIGGGKVSHARKAISAGWEDDFQMGIMVLFAALMEEAYSSHPEAVTGAPQCNNANRTPASASLRWQVNAGNTPAQFQSWHVPRFFELCGGLNLEEFNFHGDDIGATADIIGRGGSIVNIPSIIGQYADYETESVIRTPETAPVLRLAEHEALMRMAIAPYIKTRFDFLDRPQWHAMNWRTLKKDGVVKGDVRLWTDGV